MTAPAFRCEEHGYHEGEGCPDCGERGQHVLSGERRERLSRFVSGALRHFPGDAGIDLGATDDPIPDTLYHGTAPRNLESIRREGFRPMDRRAVHLSGAVETAREVGSRHAAEPAVLEVDAAGLVADGHEVHKRGAETYSPSKNVPRENVFNVNVLGVRVSATVETPDPAETCAYCGSRIFDHDPICVRDCTDDCGSPEYFCNHACLSAYIDTNELTTGDACEWNPDDTDC